ncbi:11554_t:CDS:2 [Acaulospora morrowiae]|uniref:11554_t:CDS:1 n=1 Tax=Acaulospora morrowiae TaxID=94023 RepID=A0A9N9FP58_9GLOM|nr:11554_t:CDS:2 [Acaulospora morrowiae]
MSDVKVPNKKEPLTPVFSSPNSSPRDKTTNGNNIRTPQNQSNNLLSLHNICNIIQSHSSPSQSPKPWFDPSPIEPLSPNEKSLNRVDPLENAPKFIEPSAPEAINTSNLMRVTHEKSKTSNANQDARQNGIDNLADLAITHANKESLGYSTQPGYQLPNIQQQLRIQQTNIQTPNVQHHRLNIHSNGQQPNVQQSRYPPNVNYNDAGIIGSNEQTIALRSKVDHEPPGTAQYTNPMCVHCQQIPNQTHFSGNTSTQYPFPFQYYWMTNNNFYQQSSGGDLKNKQSDSTQSTAKRRRRRKTKATIGSPIPCGGESSAGQENIHRSKSGDVYRCTNCGARETPAWRRDLQGEALLCNACGLYLKVKGCHRPTEVGPDGEIRLVKTERPGVGQPKCQNCGTTTTPCWRGPEGSKLCNRCGLFLKQHGHQRPISPRTESVRYQPY